MERLIGIVGIAALLGIAWCFCPRGLRPAISRRLVAWGIGLQLLFAVLILRTPARAAFDWANGAVLALLQFTRKGSEFLFAPLLDTEKLG